MTYDHMNQPKSGDIKETNKPLTSIDHLPSGSRTWLAAKSPI